MTEPANSFGDNALHDPQGRPSEPRPWQAADPKKVAMEWLRENAGKRRVAPDAGISNSNAGRKIQRAAVYAANSNSRNGRTANDLRRFEGAPIDESARKDMTNSIAPSTLVRWCKFNFVGGIGIGVQFAALFFLKSVMRFHYLAATAIAVEAAVVHNFVWHEQFTWADRTKFRAGDSQEFGARRLRESRLRKSLVRFLRFNLANGGVSILGNLALMKVMVGLGQVNYLLANAIAIVMCSLANFLVSERWVFGADERSAAKDVSGLLAPLIILLCAGATDFRNGSRLSRSISEFPLTTLRRILLKNPGTVLGILQSGRRDITSRRRRLRR